MKMRDEIDKETAVARVKQLAAESDCANIDSERVASALSWPLDCDLGAWSRNVLACAAAQLEANALRVWRRQAAVFVGLAALALPLTLVAAFYAASTLYGFFCALMPTSLATYLVWTYMMAALGVVGVTFALVPVALGRSHDRLAMAHSYPSGLHSTWEDPE